MKMLQNLSVSFKKQEENLADVKESTSSIKDELSALTGKVEAVESDLNGGQGSPEADGQGLCGDVQTPCPGGEGEGQTQMG